MTTKFRKQRYRARLAAGRVVLRVEVHEVNFTEAAVARGALTIAEQDDRAAQARLVGQIVKAWWKGTRAAARKAGKA